LRIAGQPVQAQESEAVLDRAFGARRSKRSSGEAVIGKHVVCERSEPDADLAFGQQCFEPGLKISGRGDKSLGHRYLNL
jgi:hypothetical protein